MAQDRTGIQRAVRARQQRITDSIWTLEQAGAIVDRTGLRLALVADLDTVIGAGLRDSGFIREAALRLRHALTFVGEERPDA